jgi:hypothetical protein
MAKNSEAEDARFAAFVKATTADERDWIAFCEFERAVDEVAQVATIVNPYDEPHANHRERDMLSIPITEVLYRVLPKVGLGTVLATSGGLGYAIRYGVLEPQPHVLDSITSDKDLEVIAERGCEAERAETEMRVNAIRADENKSQRGKRAASKAPAK